MVPGIGAARRRVYRRPVNDHADHHWGTDVQRELAPLARELRHEIPDAYAAFTQLHTATMADGALDRKTKELLAMVMAITLRCDGCIASHARGAVRAGVSRAEMAEAIGVTFLMNGGPGTVYGPRALAAYDDFAAAAAAAAADPPPSA